MNDEIMVLFATDFSDTAKNALNGLTKLKEKYKIEPVLVHVITSFWKDWFQSGMYEKEVQQRLQSWQKQIDSQSDEEKLFIEKGNAAEIIVRLAKELEVDLIVLGGNQAKPRTGISSEAIVRHASKSVWLFKTEQINQVLCGIDGTESSAKALHSAIDICSRFSAKLGIVCAIPRADFNPLGMSKQEIAKEEEKFKQQYIENIEAFLKQFDLKKVDAELSYPWGDPATVLLNLSKDLNYDLIIIGAKGHSMLEYILLGSTAEKILRKTPCSLLVVR